MCHLLSGASETETLCILGPLPPSSLARGVVLQQVVTTSLYVGLLSSRLEAVHSYFHHFSDLNAWPFQEKAESDSFELKLKERTVCL